MTRKRVDDEQYGRRLGEKGAQDLIESSPFILVNTFRFTVPADYNHDHQLATVDRNQFRYGVHDAITDANFANATQRLAPGKTYTVKVFGITRWVTSELCLDLYRLQGGILTVAQGISLLHRWAKEQLPVNKWTASFDKKDTLPLIDGLHGVPGVSRDLGGDYGFRLGYFEGDWGDDVCVLVFCDESLDS